MSRSPREQNKLNLTRRQALKSSGVGLGVATLGFSQIAVSRGATADPPEYEDINVTRESVWVETDTDTDGSGKPDRTHVDIVRPARAEGKLPVVMRADPYAVPDRDPSEVTTRVPEFSREVNQSMEVELSRPDESDAAVRASEAAVPARPLGQQSPLDRSYYYEKQLVPDGYAFAYASPIGTGGSTGCSTLGGEPEIQSVAAVIDWLNGRRTAYDAREGGEPVEANWTTGKTGMIGGSYRGALANGVAATGVDGLETIVPIRAISSWYMYVRSNGAVISPGQANKSTAVPLTTLTGIVTTRERGNVCSSRIDEMTNQLDRDTGNYNEFWAERDYLPDVDQVQASVLGVHGIYDRNVRPRHLSAWLDALGDQDVPYKAWVSQSGHDDPREHDDHERTWVELLRKWFAYWLKDEDNGVMERPTAVVERPNGTMTGEADWPSQRSEPVPMRLHPGDGSFGTLETTVPSSPGSEHLVDNSTVPPGEMVGDDNQEHRLVYRTGVLDGPVRVSGAPEPQLTLSVDSTAALLSAALVDYGPEGTEIINRGWTNVQNRESIEESQPIDPGERYTIRFPMEPVEHVFEEGHRLGVMLYSSDYNVTKRPPSTPELTVSLSESLVDVPVVGGESALTAALSGGDVPDRYGEEYDYEGEVYEIGGNGRDNGPETPTGTEDTDSSGNGSNSQSSGASDNGTDSDNTPTASSDERAEESTPTEKQTPDEAANADDDGAGVGAAGTLVSLCGLGYVLKRRQQDEK
jgi:X-Pro dipeptidyl-peptidase